MGRTLPPVADEVGGHDDVRARIIAAGAELLAEGGRDALTTRAVAAAAGVQAPTIYRLFGDKGGLLEAVAEHGLARYIAQKKAHVPLADPLEDLRAGWDFNVAFGLAHPAIFAIMNGDPRPGHRSPVVASGLAILERRIQRLAQAGRLRVPEERAVNLVRASGVGTVLVLLGMPEDRRDLGLSAAARESVIAAITSAEPITGRPGAAEAAIALRASLDDAAALTPGERHLLTELLDRLARSGA
ncbi:MULTISPECIES: TetR/AcrR family transcriptional regulator [Sorangium]|uniref:TetR/AcrR family transcriptional regulator n=1 Tax=Sorangium TaxID=39643 RepID=UPI003D9C620B